MWSFDCNSNIDLFLYLHFDIPGICENLVGIGVTFVCNVLYYKNSPLCAFKHPKPHSPRTTSLERTLCTPLRRFQIRRANKTSETLLRPLPKGILLVENEGPRSFQGMRVCDSLWWGGGEGVGVWRGWVRGWVRDIDWLLEDCTMVHME